MLAAQATARLALQWAAEAHVAIQQSLPPRPRASRVRRRMQLAVGGAARRRQACRRPPEEPGEGSRPLEFNRELQPGDPRIFRHHLLASATVQDASDNMQGTIIYCAKCYRYYHRRFFGLAARCPGVANASAASLLRRGLYPSGRAETRRWTIGPTRGITAAEGQRLGRQLCSAVAYGGPAVPRPRRIRTKSARELSQLIAHPVYGQITGTDWHIRRSEGEQRERVTAYLSGAGLSREAAEQINKAETERRKALAAARKRRRPAAAS